jgi:hypothetical protein
VPIADRGRLSYDAVTRYLRANPREARRLAAEYAVDIPARGAVSLTVCEELAYLLR